MFQKILIVLGILALFSLVFSLVYGFPAITRENGILEDRQ